MELPHLPNEIISEILSRLPVKSLIKFTLVCKPWISMIKDSKFIRTHLNRTIQANNQKETHLLLYRGKAKGFPNQYNYSLHYDNHGFDVYCKIDLPHARLTRKCEWCFRVAGVCDGLICLAADKYYQDYVRDYGSYILWNPSIRKTVILPKPNVTYASHGMFVDCIGFGFDALTSDYKVVRLVTPYKPIRGKFLLQESTLVEVYSLAKGSWTSLGDFCFPLDLSFNRKLTYVFFNGVIHWLVNRRGDDCNRPFVLTFDLGSETFGEIMLPENVKPMTSTLLSISRDGSPLVLFLTYYYKPCTDIWVMKEYGVRESWTRFMILGPQEISKHYPFSFRKSGEIFLLRKEEGHWQIEYALASLDIAGQKISSLESCENKYCLSINLYEESLVLLDVDNGVAY